MKLIKEKYRSLKPEFDYLTDEVVIAQAWKKTHGFIRTHNWYADPLQLDVSALGLEVNAKAWAKIIKEESIKLAPLELVPAAKSDPWLIDSELGWIPKRECKQNSAEPSLPIRPLAHLTIRDQTWATTLMMCLADAVETAQGDCDNRDFFQAQKLGVFSYGNRLLCDWKKEEGKAWFRWGNGETYRRFFTDYQNFLKRPIEIGRSVAQNHTDSDHIFIVNLDLKKFYDHIDRTRLLDCLMELSGKYGHAEVDDEFWASAEKITSWEWDHEAQKKAESLGFKLSDGLPQGLVSAGFFANAYMINFDKAIGKEIGNSLPKAPGVVLHDYCRYVDDLRLVVSLEDFELDNLKDLINEWIEKKLNKHSGEGLVINPIKTSISSLADLDNAGSLSGRIALLQGDLSGPADRDVLDNSMGVLEGLLTLRTDNLPDTVANEADIPLIKLAKFDNDIRTDTLKRFAANRLETIMRNKRKLCHLDGTTADSDKDSIANESELLAKKLVWAWMQDPSLALVLRKAIEIFPSPDFVEPIFESIYRRSGVDGQTEDTITAAMMDYLLADLFRCCIDFNAYFQGTDYPDNTNPDGVLDVAAIYAQRATQSETLPLFVKRQALLLLAVLQKTVSEVSLSDESMQESLLAILAGKAPKLYMQKLALFEVASQITGKPDLVSMILLKGLASQDDAGKYNALADFAKRGGPFWNGLWKQLNKSDINKSLIEKLKWAAPITVIDPKPIKQKLTKVISSEKNGFEHEVSLIKLALGLIAMHHDGVKYFPPSPIEISVKNATQKSGWGEIWRPEIETIKCFDDSKISFNDPRYVIPEWLNLDNSDSAIIYWVGTILRAAVVGNNDFTGNRWKEGKTVGYKGLKTNWFKRRMGMMHSPEALVGEYATASGWMAELLMKCLQWPGFESSYLQHDDIAEFSDLTSFKAILNKRLTKLNDLYCKTSEMPTLITAVKRPKLTEERGFRLVAVQQLLPKSNEFSAADPKLDAAVARVRNRDHLAKVCHLTYKSLTAKLKADGDTSISSADLIVLPEVAVHPDDQDIIKRLADKTKAMVLAGMVFQDHRGKLVNVARWFIPDYRESGRQWVIRDQGKMHMTSPEKKLGVEGFRPCQHVIEVKGPDDQVFRISGAICYDATDLKLAADLKHLTDLFVICAHNKDVRTFDNMAASLNYHMYQHVVIVNKGEFGGSTIQAPYTEQYDRLISHTHGTDQISIKVADLDLAAFKRKHKEYKKVKAKPAG